MFIFSFSHHPLLQPWPTPGKCFPQKQKRTWDLHGAVFLLVLSTKSDGDGMRPLNLSTEPGLSPAAGSSYNYHKLTCLLFNKLYEWLLQWKLLLCNIPCHDCCWIYFPNNLLSVAFNCFQLMWCFRCRLFIVLLRQIRKMLEMSMMVEWQ